MPLITKILNQRLFHSAANTAFRSTAIRSLTIPFLPVLPQKAGGVKGTMNDAFVPPLEDKTEGSYHWWVEKACAVSVIPMATLAMVTTGPFSQMCDTFFSTAMLGYFFLEFQSCIIDYIPARIYGKWHDYAMYLLGTGSVIAMFGIYKLEKNTTGIVGFVKDLWHSKDPKKEVKKIEA